MNDRKSSISSALDIFGRLVDHAEGSITSSTARYLLSLSFSEDDKATMHELAQRNQDGLLSPVEKDLLRDYARVGDLLAFLHSKARRALKKSKAS